MILKMLHKSTWHRLQTSQHRCKNGRLKESQTEWQTLWFKWVFFSFVDFCHKSSKLLVRAVERNSLSSLLECESVTTQDTILSVQGRVRVEVTAFEWPGVNIQSVKHRARASTVWHLHVVRNPRIQPMVDCGLSQQGLQSLACLDLTLSKRERSLW